MIFKITEKVDNHRANPNYKVLVVEFEKRDKNFKPRPLNNTIFADWIPTDEEAKALLKLMAKISPTFIKEVKELIKTLGMEVEE